MRRLAVGLLATLTVGCAFDSKGTLGGSDAGLGDESSSGGSTGGASTNGSTDQRPGSGGEVGTNGAGETTTQGPGDTTAEGGAEAGETSGGSTGTPVDCTLPQTIELTVDDATVFDPMVTELDATEGTIAYSPVLDDGEVDFTFDVECAGTYRLFGRVLDQTPGVNPDDPDSFRVFQEGAGLDWFYGCQTFGLSSGWHWVQAHYGFVGGVCGDVAPIEYVLEPGETTIRLRNREEMTPSARAAIARLTLTNDDAFAP